jgi:hypothetical protein
MERRDPVPPGRYWIVLKRDELPQWREWEISNSSKVSVVATESQFVSPDGWLWASRPEAILPGTDGIIKTIAAEWVLFDVKAPVKWVGIGLPTIVTDLNMFRTTDFITAPDPDVSGPMAQIRNLVFFAGVVYLVGTFIRRPS